MLYGLSGASGTGKSTLARKVVESTGILFMPTSITECAQKHGFNAVGAMSIEDRIRLQWHLLEDHLEMIRLAPRPLIVDRTPIDMISYMLCEIEMNSHERMTPEQIASVDRYVETAMEATKSYYDFIFLLGQLGHYEAAPTRPAANRAYQNHSQLVMEGALLRMYNKVSFACIPFEDLDERVNFTRNTIVDRLKEIEETKRTARHIH